MSIKYLPWQEGVWTRLAERREHLPHALLFHGRPGIGKLHLAEVLAQSLLCENRSNEGLDPLYQIRRLARLRDERDERAPNHSRVGVRADLGHMLRP